MRSSHADGTIHNCCASSNEIEEASAAHAAQSQDLGLLAAIAEVFVESGNSGRLPAYLLLLCWNATTIAPSIRSAAVYIIIY